MNTIHDEFLSEEDLDLRNLSESELLAWWDEWLLLAQATNDLDADEYTHGVFVRIDGMVEHSSGRRVDRDRPQ